MKTVTVITSILMFALSLSCFAQGSNEPTMLLNGTFYKVPGQETPQCPDAVKIDRESYKGWNKEIVAYGTLQSANSKNTKSYDFSDWDRFDKLGYCQLMNSGRVRWHSESLKECVLKDNDSEFVAISKEIYAPWMVGTPRSSKLIIQKTADSGIYQVTRIQQGVSNSCIYQQAPQN